MEECRRQLDDLSATVLNRLGVAAASGQQAPGRGPGAGVKLHASAEATRRRAASPSPASWRASVRSALSVLKVAAPVNGSVALDEVLDLRRQVELQRQTTDGVWEAHQAMMEIVTSLEERLERPDAPGGGPSLDFGAPIGKTMNTQDMATLLEETRHGVEECRRRLDDLSAAAPGGSRRTAGGPAATVDPPLSGAVADARGVDWSSALCGLGDKANVSGRVWINGHDSQQELHL